MLSHFYKTCNRVTTLIPTSSMIARQETEMEEIELHMFVGFR
jgi:hypothetical protein